MAARDMMAQFWVRLSNESDRKGLPNFGTPDNASALVASAGVGTSWAIHHRAKHIRVGLITTNIKSRDPEDVIFKVRDQQRQGDRKTERVIKRVRETETDRKRVREFQRERR